MKDKKRTATQIAVEMSEVRSALNGAMQPSEGESAEDHAKRRDGLIKQLADLEPEYRAALVTEASDLAKHERAFGELRPGVALTDYLKAAADEKPIEGRAAELNKELGLPGHAGVIEVPLRMLDPEPQAEARAAIDPSGTANLDAYIGQPRRWLDRILRPSMASRIGVTMDTVGVGEPVYPQTTTGTSAHQVGRGDAIGEASFAFSLTKMTPKRYGASYRVRYEDLRSIPQFEQAIRRDLEMVLGLHVDEAVFVGMNPAGTDADITGLDAATGVQDLTVTAANALKVEEIYKVLASMVDGIRLPATGDARMVASSEANAKWAGTFYRDAANGVPHPTDEWLRGKLAAYGVYNGLGGNATPATGDIVGIGSKPRGLGGAAVVAMWPSIQLIRDPYSSAQSGEVVVTLQGLYDFAVIRADQFFRVKVS